eukprot:6894119-Karenia_brevis.AAC.1
MKHFVPCFQSISAIQTDMLPGVTKGIVACVEHDPLVHDKVDLSCLTPTQKRYLEDSSFYRSFLKYWHDELAGLVVKAHHLTPEKRLEIA